MPLVTHLPVFTSPVLFPLVKSGPSGLPRCTSAWAAVVDQMIVVSPNPPVVTIGSGLAAKVVPGLVTAGGAVCATGAGSGLLVSGSGVGFAHPASASKAAA